MPVSFFPFSASHLPRTRSKPGPRCRTPFGTVLLLSSVRIFFLLGYPPFHTGISYHLRRLNILRRLFHLFHFQDTQGRPVLPDQPHWGGRAIDLYREFISLRYPALFRRRAAGQPARRMLSFVLSCFWVSCLFCWMVSKSVFVRFGIRWRTIRFRDTSR